MWVGIGASLVGAWAAIWEGEPEPWRAAYCLTMVVWFPVVFNERWLKTRVGMAALIVLTLAVIVLTLVDFAN